MTANPLRPLVVKVVAGVNDPERCAQAFNVAAIAAASGSQVSLWLAGEAAWLALPGKAAEFSLDHAAPLEDLLAAILATGSVTLCSQCAQRRNITSADVLSGIRIAGAASYVEEILTTDAQALVY
ncbi:MAG TPA: sulfur reduction protein DsrE [Actinobacteria bacterium]|nr:sulfur reduction protein DsrE [Actinomycetota bacterium]